MKTILALTLTCAVAAPEVILIKEIEKVNNDIVISFKTENQQRYIVEFITDLSSRKWVPLTNEVYGTGLIQAVTNYNVGHLNYRFYRVKHL